MNLPFPKSSIALGFLAACAPVLPAWAADPDAPALNPVIVTGTRASDRTELTSSVPVDIVTAADLRAAAGSEGNLGQALASILPSFNYLDQSNSGSADHVRAAQLRGLNPDQLLVLINGKRVHATSIVNVESVIGLGSVAVDFASIPINAIKRIEVLRDGAGAQYGSDAIAGVVNIILDDSRSGGELSVNSGLFHTHFAPTEKTINDGQTYGLQAKHAYALGDQGSLNVGLDFTHHQPTNRAGFDSLYTPTTLTNPPPTVTFGVGDARLDNVNLWANSHLALEDGATGYSTLLLNRRWSRGDAFFRESNDYSNYALYTTRYPNGFLPESTGLNQDIHWSGGMRGQALSGWSYDASLTYGTNLFRYGLDHSLNASLGDASPTRFNLGDFRFNQTSLNVDLSHDLRLSDAATPFSFAVGFEARKESYQTSPGDLASYVTGPFGLSSNPALINGLTAAAGAQGDAGLPPADAASTARHVLGTYAELSGNVLKQVFADAAVRWDHDSDAGSALTGKISTRWELAQNWALRAAASSNFRAPALAQISSAYAPTLYTGGTGSNVALGTVNILPVSDPIAQSLGATTLKPERSHNLSLGITAQPLSSLQFSADAFRIRIDDRIALSEQLSPTSGPGAGNTYQFFTNAVDTNTQGAELVGSWHGHVLGGKLQISDASMWAANTIRNIHAGPAQIGTLTNASGSNLLFGLQAQNAITTAVPKRRDVITSNWGDTRWNLLARLTHTGEVSRVFDFTQYGGGVATQTYGSTWQLDLEAERTINARLALALGVQNLTDRYPTQSNSSINYYGNLPYDFLAPIGFNGRYLYARVRYLFP